MKYLYVILLIPVLRTCMLPFDRGCSIHVINNTEQRVTVCFTCSDTLGTWDNFSEKYQRYQYYLPKDIIEPESYKPIIFTEYYNNIKNMCQDKKLRFYFISDTVKYRYTWGEICKNQLYEKLVFSDEDLENMNWGIEYNK